jgi:alcohol dehydrogenase (NADP+)
MIDLGVLCVWCRSGMEDIYSLGLAKAIGVSNFSVSKLTAMKSYAKTFPMVNQVELHPYNRQDELVAEMKKMGVVLTAYCPLGSPDSALMFNRESIKLLEHPDVVGVAAEAGKTTGQVLIRWAVQRGTTVVPKSVTPSRIEQNFDVFSFELSEAQMQRLSSIEAQKRACDGSFWVCADGPYRSMDELWA